MSDRTRDERRDDPDRGTEINETRTDPERDVNERRTDRGSEFDERRADPDQTADYGPNRSERGKWMSGLVVLAGLWLILEPFLMEEMLVGNLWNDVIVGVALVALGGYNYYRRTNEQFGSTAVAGLVALLGLWLIVSPFVYGDAGAADATSDFGFWNDVVVGLIVFGLGAYSAYEAREVDRRATTAADR